MPDQVTRNNHYVPQWYQRGFLESGQSHLHYLDTSPEQKILPDGRTVPMNAAHRWGPKNCFYEYDLYSTHFGTVVNDEVEKFLFGSIDVRGTKAVRAFAGGDLSAMHDTFQDFFEYLDAQKLRTPKGLDWIKSRYSSLDQLQLMREMQGLRFMHCTMWTEGVREIVSAEESDVKFIVSDHPVTIYNAAAPPTSPECAYPDDPSIEWVGSQTVFVLDANTCLILTHLEYAQAPKSGNLTAPRTHARYRGQSLVRTDAFIRTRKLSRDEITTINHLLKSRARRYLAASNKEWLYPEKSFTGAWQDIAQVLLPRDDLWRFGGEIYVGHADGSTQYQDAFGRTSGAHEYLRRKKRKTGLGPNDFCGCGSGRKFKHCCKDLPSADRPTWDVYGIRERNLMFCHVVQDTLGLKSGKTWDDVRRELSDEQVKRIHEAFASLWPEDTDLSELLPRPRNGTFRAVYLGTSDPRTVEATVLGWLPYFDQVILAHPFINPLRIKPEFSPTKSPSQHRAQTLKNVLLLLLLEPYIRAGYVHLIPDPGDFNSQFGMSALQMAEQRTAGWKPDRKSAGRLEALAKDDHQRLMRQLPESSLRRSMRQHMPEASDAEIDSVIAYMKSELAADPYALLQPIEPGESGAQFLYFKGYSLESAMYLASLTGSAIYTDVEAHWQQLHTHAQQADRAPNTAWTPVVDSLRVVNFPIDMNAQTLYETLQGGRFGSMKAVLRRFVDGVQQSSGAQQPEQIALQFAKAHQAMQGELADMPDALRLVGHVELSVPVRGFERNDVRRLLLTFGRAKSVRPIPFAMLINLEAATAADGYQ
ncbi:DUF4238 domain-containing protein [Limnobacter litoralis]|uniref:DUF4238 domain-containing protein n=1 Tax=Limnobacter litoralis TaxID=481366 RepID=A0ABQ5YSY1_9BURK|nr:DUF4238 domain-containing protein [Limnobacter litoralis]GLR26038.1 hypothetical protein GCM10007875_11260 [Limnobacter litoralis]